MKQEAKLCKLHVGHERGVAVSANCECGVTFTPPAAVDKTSLASFEAQFCRHYGARYATRNLQIVRPPNQGTGSGMRGILLVHRGHKAFSCRTVRPST
jgi:hypothetical protein